MTSTNFLNKTDRYQKLFSLIFLFCSFPLLSFTENKSFEERLSKLEEAFSTSKSGFTFKNGESTLTINGWLQTGFRASDKADINNSEFYIRRARLDLKGDLEKEWSYRIYAAFEGSAAKLQESWLQYNYGEGLKIRFGQIKPGYSLETTYSARWTPLIERSLAATNISTYEDLGITFFGNLFDKQLFYALSCYNGEGKNSSENNSHKEVSGRLRFSPFQKTECKLFKKLYLGGSFGKGRVDESLSSISYKTASRVSFVTFPSTTTQKGTLLKYGAEFEWLYKQFKLMSEHLTLKRNHVINGAIDRPLTTRSWYLTASYFLTGEETLSAKAVKPLSPYRQEGKGCGAWEIAARYENLKTTAAAFSDGVINGAQNIDSASLGINWWPNHYLRASLNLVRTDFNENLTFGDLTRDYENALITQFQFSY